MTKLNIKLPKFGLDPYEFKEVQRLRREGKHDQAAAVEAHFKKRDTLPVVTLHTSGIGPPVWEVDGSFITEPSPLVQWMIDTGRVGRAFGL